MLKEYLKIAIKNLRTRPIRSWLTILGIVIGVFLIIGLLSLANGLKAMMLQQLNALGGEIIFVMPGEESSMITSFIGGGGALDKEDIEAIKKVEGVETVLPTLWASEVIRYEGEKKGVMMGGYRWEEAMEVMTNFQGWSLKRGRWPIIGKREIVLGSITGDSLFENEVNIGDDIVIRGRKFEVVGVLNSLGNKNDDTSIAIEDTFFYQITGMKEGKAQLAMVKIEPGADLDETANRIKAALEEIRKRKRGKDVVDITVITSEKVSGIVGDVMGVIEIAVFALASIGIIVGGIGIMNTMYTSVHERVKEIGIMKAVGAKNSVIILIFLIESGIIGLVGGAGGVILGFLMAKSVEFFAQLYFEASVSLGLALFGLTFSFVIGCVSGFFPSRKAAKLKPVDALMYE